MRSYFLEHEEYTHLILHPDDLIVNYEHYVKLMKNIEEHDFPVISGICNVDSNSRNHILACVDKPFPSLKRNIRSYKFMSVDEINTGIRRMLWIGFPFMWVRRDIMEKIEFEDDSRWNMNSPNLGWGFDIVFCHYCKELDIPVYADLNVFMKHYKGDRSIEGYLIKTGSVPPKVLLVKDDVEYDITNECNSKYLTKQDWIKYPHMNTTTGRTDMI